MKKIWTLIFISFFIILAMLSFQKIIYAQIIGSLGLITIFYWLYTKEVKTDVKNDSSRD